MDELARMCERERAGDFAQNAAYIGDRQRTTLRHLRGEIVAINARHDEVHQSILLIDRINRHDVWM